MIVVPLRQRRTTHLRRGRRKPAVPVDLPPIEVKSAASWRYQWHELVLERADLSRSEIAVAGALMHRFDGGKGYAEIGLSALAKRAGCSRRAAILATQRLRALGLIVAANEGARVRGRLAMATHRYRLIYRDRGVAWGGEAYRTTW